MNNFNDRVYLLLTLKRSEIQEYYFQTVAVILAIALYNLIGVFLNTPILIGYWALLTAMVLVTVLFLYLGSNVLSIDWDLLERVEESLKVDTAKPKVKAEEISVVETDEVLDELPSNKEIQMVESDEYDFDFGDSLASLYKTGTPKELVNSAVNGVEQKVRRMNLG